jgi:hypothetical protein
MLDDGTLHDIMQAGWDWDEAWRNCKTKARRICRRHKMGGVVILWQPGTNVVRLNKKEA